MENSKQPIAGNIKNTILVVDDNEEILEFLSDDLQKEYTVLTATDGENALQALSNHIVHLVVSDVMMPKMDGFELCHQIKSNFELSHIPIILLTAKNTLQSKIEGLKSGADVYIEKPFSPEHLNAQIFSLLNNRNKIKEYFAKSPLAQFSSVAHSKMDEEFIERLHTMIRENITDWNLDVEKLAVKMNMSRPTLYRKIKSISNLSPNEMINLTRLKKAAELISLGNTRMNEIAEIVGYHSLTQFGRNFLKQFNMTPTDYAKQVKTKTSF
jgi:DNA-binding response OmpR family regulator